MKCELKWMLAAILICGTTAVLTSCSDQIDNPTPQPEGGTVDNDLAVKCINGTFIGKKTDNVIMATCAGRLRWNIQRTTVCMRPSNMEKVPVRLKESFPQWVRTACI